MTEEQANTVYDILVAHAGAPEFTRTHFAHVVADGSREFRFRGSLGFGGKFYVAHKRWYVGCYPEDITDVRQSAIDATNTALAELYTKEMAT